MFIFKTKKGYIIQFDTLFNFCVWMYKKGIIYYHPRVYIYKNEILLESPKNENFFGFFEENEEKVEFLLEEEEFIKISFIFLIKKEIKKMNYVSLWLQTVKEAEIDFLVEDQKFADYSSLTYKDKKFYDYSGKELLLDGNYLYNPQAVKIIDGKIFTLDKITNVVEIINNELVISLLPFTSDLVDIGHDYNDICINFHHQSPFYCWSMPVQGKLNRFFRPNAKSFIFCKKENTKNIKKLAFKKGMEKRQEILLQLQLKKKVKTPKTKNPFEYSKIGDLIHINHLPKLMAIKDQKPNLFFVDDYKKDLIVSKKELLFVNKGTNNTDSYYNFDFSFNLKIEKQKIQFTKELKKWVQYSTPSFSLKDIFNSFEKRQIYINENEFSFQLEWKEITYPSLEDYNYNVTGYITQHKLSTGEVIFFGSNPDYDYYDYPEESSSQDYFCSDILIFNGDKLYLPTSRFEFISACFPKYGENKKIEEVKARIEKAKKEGIITPEEDIIKKIISSSREEIVDTIKNENLIFLKKTYKETYKIYKLDKDGLWSYLQTQGGELVKTVEIGRCKIYPSPEYLEINSAGFVGKEENLPKEVYLKYPIGSSVVNIQFDELPTQILTRSNKKDLVINGKFALPWYTLK